MEIPVKSFRILTQAGIPFAIDTSPNIAKTVFKKSADATSYDSKIRWEPTTRTFYTKREWRYNGRSYEEFKDVFVVSDQAVGNIVGTVDKRFEKELQKMGASRAL